jgi:hypothetical protein
MPMSCEDATVGVGMGVRASLPNFFSHFACGLLGTGVGGHHTRGQVRMRGSR